MYLFGSLILAAISTCSAANELNHFAYSCDSSTLSGTVLISNCQREDGLYVSSSIDLVDCLVNTNGILAYCQNGNYGPTCSGYSLSGTVLSCTCLDFQQAGQSTSIDLNCCVTNTDGTLTC
ncbi:hypothetical protein SCLCIDRAFT_1216463 [Scleroderma citrinum Foug A]|uniref:Cyanovirin-N domain-containing protein n=1 Tax=Scleroderma citrinum Foug A TaxID=1036808 RepID=A0A0C3DJ88_9AGAM|nr:hypothetical protein SCLCIDRAFT_1216463 [Scleroderma citrinum Foug A]